MSINMTFLLFVSALCCSFCQADAVPVVRNEQVLRFKPEVAVMDILRESGQKNKLPMTQLYRFHGIEDLQGLRKNSICSCTGTQCGCCVHLDVEKIELDQTACVNVTYLSEDLGFEFTLSLDGIVIIDRKISVRNPPPICAGIPYLEKYASACVKFRDLDFKNKQFSGCISIEVMFAGEELANFDLGCFHIPPQIATRPSGVGVIRGSAKKQATSLQLVPLQKANRPMLQTVEDLQYKDNSVCSCKGYNCGCCLHLEIDRISLNETGCVNISYLPKEIGIEFELTLNGKVIIDDKVSVSNPPPICAAVPYLHKLASVCVHFRDLEVKDEQLSGCAAIEFDLAGETLETFDLGCFHIPPKAVKDAPIRVGIN